MAILEFPGKNISEVKIQRDVVFEYMPTDDAGIVIWETKGVYDVQVHGHGNIYKLTETKNQELAYGCQRLAKELLESGAKVVITGANTAKIGNLEERLRKYGKK
jgi:hypothetical protein